MEEKNSEWNVTFFESEYSWNSCHRFRWTLDFYSRIELFLFHLNWNRWSSESLFQVFVFPKSLKRNAAIITLTLWICRIRLLQTKKLIDFIIKIVTSAEVVQFWSDPLFTV